MASSITLSESAGVRYLHFGSHWVQGAMRIRKPFALELAYTREMMAGLLLRDAPWPRSALLIGLGAGSLAKFIHHQLPDTRSTVVEIDPAVIPVAHAAFRLPPPDERLRIVVGDGADYVAGTRRRFDLILVDGFDRNARAGVLDTEAFYAACRARLSAEGLLAANLFGRSRGFRASLARLAGAFEGRAFAFPSCDSGNVIALAAAGEAIAVDMTTLRARADALRSATGLDLRPTLSRVQLAASLPAGTLRL
jgi:spermidine synthase